MTNFYYNHSFEDDRNQNNLPDFWEVNWRNGSSEGSIAVIAPYVPTEGKSIYRLYNGMGDVASYQYVDSEWIPVRGIQNYTVLADMRYGFNTNGNR
ncbi:hypothetical protein [Paenibacillus sp. FSL H8-0537]|uniref:hypothetical protein n=1 Tax=Paenibacillus sp. FSL H8-0537 TaxID=2921399 RepID=UPI003100EC68